MNIGALDTFGIETPSADQFSHRLIQRSSEAKKLRSKQYQVTRQNGYILHEDRLRVIIATGFVDKSENPKTGDMIQVFVLVKGMSPSEAIKSGKDKLICGNCPLRGINGEQRTCYVIIHQAPRSVWEKYSRGGYTVLKDYSLFDGLAVRFGAYGDPAFLPLNKLRMIASRARKWTGYTHQWRNPLFAQYREFLMASVETLADLDQAHRAGWRTFRVTAKGELPTGREIVCANTSRGVTCAQCGLCNGTTLRAKSIVIEAHGNGAANLESAIESFSV